jgi:hypothetical protein
MRLAFFCCALLGLQTTADSAMAASIVIQSVAVEEFSGVPPKPTAQIFPGKTGTKQETESGISFDFDVSAGSPSATLTVSLTSDTDGFVDYQQQFEVLYDAKSNAYFPILAQNKTSLPHLENFVGNVVVPTELRDVFALNQRARILFHERSKHFFVAPPVWGDVATAYWLAQSSAALISKLRMKVDTDTTNAVSFLQHFSAKSPHNAAIFADFLKQSGVSQDQVNDVVEKVLSRDATVTSLLIKKLGIDMGLSSSSDAACQRVKTLDGGLRDANDDETTVSVSEAYQHFLVLSLSINCDTKPLIVAHARKSSLTADQIDLGKRDLQRLADLASVLLSVGDLSEGARTGVRTGKGWARDFAQGLGVDLPEPLM